MRAILILILFFVFHYAAAQHSSLDTIKAPSEFANVHVQRITGDSLSTTFVIWIKQEVKSHKHEWHSENIVVLEGEGIMKLGDKTFTIRAGDHVFIPRQTFHSVTVTKGILKVLSIQSPNFDGSDRVWENK